MGFGDLLKEGQQLAQASNMLNQLSGNNNNNAQASGSGSNPDYAAYAEDAKDAYTAFSGEGTFQEKAQRAFNEISANHSGKQQNTERKEEDNNNNQQQ